MKTSLFFAALFLISGVANADRQELLGSTYISNGHDYDVVQIHSCGFERDMVAALQLRFSGDAVKIEYLEVEYGNGERDQLNVREYFNPGQATRWMDLRGAARCVKNVKIYAESRPDWRGRQSLVEVWGWAKRVRRDW
jgi:hypothetical protein